MHDVPISAWHAVGLHLDRADCHERANRSGDLVRSGHAEDGGQPDCPRVDSASLSVQVHFQYYIGENGLRWYSRQRDPVVDLGPGQLTPSGDEFYIVTIGRADVTICGAGHIETFQIPIMTPIRYRWWRDRNHDQRMMTTQSAKRINSSRLPAPPLPACLFG